MAEVIFNFGYTPRREDLAAIYEKAKGLQWNASVRIDWTQRVDAASGILDETEIAIYGTAFWERLAPPEKARLNFSWSAWKLSQILHGEQGALLIAAQVAASIPLIDGKFFMASQVMDEARHTEVFARYIDEKLGRRYPINPNLLELLDRMIADSRWYVKLLGVQLIVEGLAVANFKNIFRATRDPLLKEILLYVLQDESRHVAFGLLALQEVVAHQVTPQEKGELARFAYESCMLLGERYFPEEVYAETFLPGEVAEISEISQNAPHRRAFRSELFSMVIPNLERIGLLTGEIRPEYQRAGLIACGGGENV